MSLKTTTPVLFSFPIQARVSRVVPKSKIYEHGPVNTALRDKFVRQVEQITWAYKLAPETINLPARGSVPEIQVFEITQKIAELDDEVLRAIDRAISLPIIFELHYEQRTRMVAAFKRNSEADASRWVLSDYFATAWLPSDIERTAIPLALDLGGLYEQVLQRLIPTPARPQESLADLVARVELVVAKQREVEKTANKLAKEKQFNRKVEINATLRQLKTELEQLSR